MPGSPPRTSRSTPTPDALAMEAALKLLNRRAMSAQQLTRRLLDKGYGHPTILRVISRLTDLGLLNDRQLGESLISAAVAREAAGPRLLKAKLLQRGLKPELVEQLIDQFAPSREDAIAQAAELAHRVIDAMQDRSCDPRSLKRRLWQRLARRGFSPDVIRAAVNQAISS